MNKIYHSRLAKSKNVIINMIITGVSFFLITFCGAQIFASTITYIYDNLNRLTGVNYGNEAVIVYSYDAAGNRLTLTSSSPTPPTTPYVTDDGKYTTNLSQLHAVWTSDDPQSGIVEYQYAIGTTPLGIDIVGWTSSGLNNSVTRTGLNAGDQTTYYISVKARNGMGIWSLTGSSDGIMALTPLGDADGDGLTNDQEVNTYNTDPLIADTDGDGMNDKWEIDYGLNPLDPADALLDADKDGFSNLTESQKGTNPNDSTSHPPVAYAGSDQNAQTGSKVILDGSESTGRDGNLITFNWIQAGIPAGSTSVLSNTNIPKPFFTADKDGAYSYDLTVCDSLYCSNPDSVTVFASVPNVSPNADAGSDQNVLTGQYVSLNGSFSNDPDNGPGAMIYLWGFQSVPTGSLLTDVDISGSNTPRPGFTPDVNGQYHIDLAVTDSVAVSHDQVIITADATTPPVAIAGIDQLIKLGVNAVLDGSGSHDDDGLPQALTYQWSFVSIPAGSSLTNSNITNANTSLAGFTPDTAGSYVVQLIVNDGQAKSTDNVVISVDGTAPSGTVIINNNALWTKITAVSLKLTCTDDMAGSGCSDMQLSNDGVFDTEPWQSFVKTKPWTLPSGDGNKKVYVRFRDTAGNPSANLFDNIYLDTAKPVVSGVSDSPDPFKHLLGEVSTINFTVSDNLSVTCIVGVAILNASKVEVRRIIKNSASCPTGGASGTFIWDGKNKNGVLAPAGTYTYKIMARDQALNDSAMKQGTVAVE